MGKQWDKRFMELSQTIAAWSEDRDRGVGAVIVGEGNVIYATGYNGLCRGVKDSEDKRFDRASGEKFFWVEHAERNAIYNAARIGVALTGTRIYINRFPCADCARAIIQSGIAKVICPPRPTDDGKLDYSFEVAETMLKEGGVTLRLLA